MCICIVAESLLLTQQIQGIFGKGTFGSSRLLQGCFFVSLIFFYLYNYNQNLTDWKQVF